VVRLTSESLETNDMERMRLRFAKTQKDTLIEVSGLVAGEEFSLHVFAGGRHGFESHMRLCALNSPEYIRFTSVTATSVSLEWDAVLGADCFRIETRQRCF